MAIEQLHAWGLSTSRTALTAHLRIDSAAQLFGTDPDALLRLARERLAGQGIAQCTVQLESSP